MEKRQRLQSSSLLIACGIIASLAAPARAQYQYMGQSGTMVVGAASNLIRAGSSLTTGLVRAVVPHRSHKNKDKNKNDSLTNGNGQMSASNNTAPGQYYSGANGQPTGNMMPMQTNMAPMQSGYGNMQAQNYQMQNAQPQYNNAPTQNQQYGQNAYSTVQGQMYNAPGQASYGMPGASGPYNSSPAH